MADARLSMLQTGSSVAGSAVGGLFVATFGSAERWLPQRADAAAVA